MSENHTSDCERLEQENRILRQRLLEAQRLVALGELVSTTTHEFNNVLMTIINYAKLGLRHSDDPTRGKAFEKILAASARAARITNGILGMARNRTAGQEPTNLAALVDDTLLLLEREMNKYRIRVEKQFNSIPDVYVNGSQIQQVLLNLLINARQAMPRGGRVMIRLGYDAAMDMVDLVVRDYGCGIAAENLPHIFDPFYTTKPGPDASGKGGTGLGLSLCKEIIEAHSGRIRVESAVGKGTQFTVKLPTVTKAATSREPIPDARAAVPSTGSSQVPG